MRTGEVMMKLASKFCASFLLLCVTASAIDEFAVEAKLSKRLIEIGMFDYATLHVEGLQKTGAEPEAVSILNAQLLAGQGKRSAAYDVLKGVKSSSKYYVPALLLIPAMTSDLKARVAAYQAYFKAVPEPPAGAENCRDWQGVVMRYADSLKKQNRPGEVEKTLKLLEKGCGPGEGGAVDENMVAMIGLRFKLEALEKEAKPAPAKVDAVIKELEKMRWGMDYFSSLAYVEIARAMILKGKFQEAIELLAENTEFLMNMHTGVVKDTGSSAQSPLAGAFYYIGIGYEKIGDSKKEGTTERKKMHAKAYKKFRKVATDFSDASIAVKALMAKDRVGQKLGGVRESSQGASALKQQGIQKESADAQYRDKKYDRAIELYLKALNVAPGSKLAPEIMALCVACLKKQDRMLEAVALTMFMAEFYPDSPKTGDSLYNLAVSMWKTGIDLNKTGKVEPAKAAKADAIRMFAAFAEANPTHLKAAFAAYTVASEKYAQGDEWKKKKAAAKSVKEGNEAILAMRKAFREAIPAFEYVVDNYGSSKYAAKALYRLAWIYRILTNDEATEENEDQLCADTFLKFCALATEPTADRLIAKYEAADRLYALGNMVAGEKHFSELVGWIDSGAFKGVDKVAEYRKNATAMNAWCVDAQALGLRGTMDAVREEIEALPPQEGGEPAVVPAELQAKLVKAEGEWKAGLKRAIDSFTQFLGQYAKDEQQAPSVMAKLGAIYTADLDDAAMGQTWFERLSKTFPNSSAAKQSVFTLGRVYIKNGQWAKANETYTKVKDQFAEHGYANLYFISRQPMQPAGEEKQIGLDPLIAIAANEALLAIAKDKKHEDNADAVKRRELVSLRVTDGYVAMKRFEDALSTYDRMIREEEQKKRASGKYSSFYFKVMMGQAQAFRVQGETQQAVDALNTVLSMINATSFPTVYFKAVCDLGDAMADSKDIKFVKKAAYMYQQTVEFAPRDNEEILPYIERGYFGAAWNLSRLNMTDQANEMRKAYLSEFGDGKFRKEIYSLPSPEFFDEK